MKHLAKIFKTELEAQTYVKNWVGEIVFENNFYSVYFIPVPKILELKPGSVGEWLQNATQDELIKASQDDNEK